jgi:hypothetical protein
METEAKEYFRPLAILHFTKILSHIKLHVLPAATRTHSFKTRTMLVSDPYLWKIRLSAILL